MADASADASNPNAALQAALARLLAPLAQLVVAKGLPYAALDEMLRSTVVATAHAAHPGLPEHRRASRVSAATGLNRREVNRLLEQQQAAARQDQPAASPRSPAAMVFAHWRATAAYRTRAGAPRVLPRTGDAPSFESLAHDVTRDVHPRALLEELLRLKLATHDTARDTVALAKDNFVPRGDAERMVQWMGANVGDHLAGAVANLLGRKPEHAEQAIAAEGLTAASVAQVRPLLHAHWQRLTDELVPLLERLIEQDAAQNNADDPNTHRVRFGLYAFDTAPATAPVHDAPADNPPRRTRKEASNTASKTTSRKAAS
jgi:Family of unknown function (DUF6502)